MSNIEKIKAEIERRKKRWMYDDLPIAMGRYYEDRDLLAFIDSLPEDKPSEDVEDAARYSEILTYPMPDDGDIEKVMQVQEARIFHEIGFKAGAEWQRIQMPMPEDP